MKARSKHIELLHLALLAGIFIIGMDTRSQAQNDGKTKPGQRSQIVDDSSRNVYGPKTTLWTTEKNLFYNKKNSYVRLDTAILNYHRWTYIQRFNNFYKDLGNMGTALCPIFPSLNGTIGVNSGFTSYEPYFQTEEPKYYDSKSPYTRIYVVWGGSGRATTRVEFTRNITPRWNFGFDYRPILADKQFQYKKADRQTVSHYYDFYTTYKTKNNRYLLLFNYRRIRHRVFENGGIVISLNDPYSKYFNKDAPVNLSNDQSVHTITEEKRSVLHLFQQYELARPFQVYLISDVTNQINRFSKNKLENYSSYFSYTRGDSLNASDVAQLLTIQNEAGIKGNVGPLFYNFYYKIRSYDYENLYSVRKVGDLLAYKKSSTEHYTGGRVALRFDSLTEFSGSAEYLLDGNYRMEAVWKSPWIDASGIGTLSKPGFMQQVYYGSHNLWNNSFANVSAFQVNGFLKAQLGPLFISPGATFTNLNNFIYFKEKSDSLGDLKVKPYTVLPFQSHGTQTVFCPELRMTLRLFKHFFLRPQVIYTSFLKNDNDVLHIPNLFVNGQVAFENLLFKGNLQVQVGVDAHWKSAYKALGYDVTIQQFYVQNQFTSPSFLLADIFFDAKLKRGKFFFKYHNLVQAFKQTGYVPTPGYPGQHPVLDFGFELLLFD